MPLTTISLSSALDNHYKDQSVTATTLPFGLVSHLGRVNQFNVATDSVDAVAAGCTGLTLLGLDLTTNTAAATGSRAAANVTARITQVSTTPIQPNSQLDFLGLSCLGQIQTSAGGVDLTVSGCRGQVYGAGINVIAANAATNLNNLTGMEVETTVTGTASVRLKSGISIAQGSGDVTQGTQLDAALSISSQVGAAGWKNGILFSDYNGQQPCSSNGTLIACSGSATIARGIDFSSYTFTGAPLIMPLKTGSVTSSSTGVAGMMCWDASYIYVCTSADSWKRAALSTW